MKGQLTTAALTAKAIREELKTKFPTIKFSVKSSNFSMGNSVDIDWTDGPSREQVEETTKKYQYGHFDGMTDCYEYSNKVDNIPQAKFVMAQRTLSDELVKNCAEVIAKEEGIEFDGDLGKSFTWHDQYYNWSQIVYQFVNKIDFTGKNGLRALEEFSGSIWGGYEAVQIEIMEVQE